MQDVLPAVVSEVLHPTCWFLPPDAGLNLRGPSEAVVAWEIYRGRLLDPGQARELRQFDRWDLHWRREHDGCEEPLISILFDGQESIIHLVRHIQSYAWEGYDAGGNVFLSRQVQRWVAELVGSLDLHDVRDLPELRRELAHLVFVAVIGTSRLPLTSVESPLPAYSLGQLGYFRPAVPPTNKGADQPLPGLRELLCRGLTAELSIPQITKLVELTIRATPADEMAHVTNCLVARWRQLGRETSELLAVCRAIFNDAALSPYTCFVPNALTLFRRLSESAISADEYADLLSFLLRQMVRHLTAYDLVTFHHRGANYPDALFLHDLLESYADLAEIKPCLFADDHRGHQGRRRRRALRQAWLLRQFYTGLPVPGEPTSPGENTRVLPAPHVPISEEELHQPAQRKKRLWNNEAFSLPGPNSRDILEQALADLSEPRELQELGMALFLDRPIGASKPPGEPDATVLLSYEAFSPSLARKRLDFLASKAEAFSIRRDTAAFVNSLHSCCRAGLPVPDNGLQQRPGVVSLADARRVAPDFVILRTTRRSLQDFLEQYDFDVLRSHVRMDWLGLNSQVTIIGDGPPAAPKGPRLTLYDKNLRKRLALQVDLTQGWLRLSPGERPRAGLRVIGAWEAGLNKRPDEMTPAAVGFRVMPRR